MPAFRQVGEKQLPNPVLCMAWSPKRDLIALANTAGELLLHRLANFQRVWSLPPNENTGKEITALAWRPDGKILAFSLGDTKVVVLCDAEKAEILHLFPLENPVSCMHWMEVLEESSVLNSFYTSEDESNLFLPKLPTLPKSYSTTSKIFSEEKSDEILNLLGEVRLNILVLGGGSGFVELYAYGMYKIATLPGVPGTCSSLCLSSDLKSLSIITEIRSAGNDPEICYIQLDTGLLSDCLPEVTRMARKFTHISTLLQYLRLSLTCMCEAWEDILMQMDLRLTKFVQVSGHCLGPELQALLMNQLTVKGLKKLGQSIETSYSSIQKLVISHLQSGSEALLYHLSEVKGMSLWKQKFQPLGLDSAAIEDAITAVGSFTLKANELLQVIDKSMKNFKAFFRWLYVAMLRMSEEHVPPELNKMTQKDIAFVADFLSEHFTNYMPSPLTHLKESPLLFPSYSQKSLHFVKRMMEGVIELCLQKPAEVIGKSVKQAVCLPLYTVPESDNNCYRTMFFVACLCFSSDCVYSCQDARFYDDETLTVVLRASEEDNRGRVLAQLPLGSALSCEEEFTVDICYVSTLQSGAIPVKGLVLENQWRDLENMKAQFVAVNGIRKVACVLSSNLRHVRVYEMDVEDEEDEERPESQNASSDQDGLEETPAIQGEAEGGETEGGGQRSKEQLESGEALELS
uniref:Anaphase-promoting complex subunit 4 n=1 Tax=Salmo trutta TaxID=8032 RepID=A0A673WZY4_SALTR